MWATRWILIISTHACSHSPCSTFTLTLIVKQTQIQSRNCSVSTKQQIPCFPDAPLGNYKCGYCVHRDNVSNSKVFFDPGTGKKKFINFTTTNVVYMLRCPCGLCRPNRKSFEDPLYRRGSESAWGEQLSYKQYIHRTVLHYTTTDHQYDTAYTHTHIHTHTHICTVYTWLLQFNIVVLFVCLTVFFPL